MAKRLKFPILVFRLEWNTHFCVHMRARTSNLTSVYSQPFTTSTSIAWRRDQLVIASFDIDYLH